MHTADIIGEQVAPLLDDSRASAPTGFAPCPNPSPRPLTPIPPLPSPHPPPPLIPPASPLERGNAVRAAGARPDDQHPWPVTTEACTPSKSRAPASALKGVGRQAPRHLQHNHPGYSAGLKPNPLPENLNVFTRAARQGGTGRSVSRVNSGVQKDTRAQQRRAQKSMTFSTRLRNGD